MNTPTRGTKPWRLPLRAVNHEPAPLVFRMVAHFVRILIPLVTRRHWAGRDNIPTSGGALVVANHSSNFDALALGEFIIWSGRWPRYLGKSDIWRVPVLGWVVRRCEQIPVYRNGPKAKDSLIHAKQALDEGKLVAMFPEGTITADPDGWPMNPRTGAARLALETGLPVIPIGHTGAEFVLGGHELELGRLFRLRRRDVHIVAGPPVDLSRFQVGGTLDHETLEAASVAIMDAVTAIVEDLRGESAPLERWDMRSGTRVPQRRG